MAFSSKASAASSPCPSSKPTAGTSPPPATPLPPLTPPRLPLWFWTQFITMCMVVGCVCSTSFEMFTVFRSLQGLFGTVPQVIGLPIIHDMYHRGDWPRMINVWGTTFLVGPFVGPALAGYLLQATGTWVGSFAVLAGLYAASTIAIAAFARETYYVRGQGTQEAPRWKSFFGLGNTGKLGKTATVVAQSKAVVVMIFRLPLLLVGTCPLPPHQKTPSQFPS